MAWRLTIGGVDRTAAVDSFSTTVALNDRARATVVVGDLMPARFAELVSYAADGVTPLFGGVILQRNFQGRTPYDPTFQLSLDVGDWMTYADWAFTTKAYPAAVMLRQVLSDLVVEHLAQYGITLDPDQVDGPTIAPFTWAQKRVSDALRELSDRTTYVVKIDPAKRLRMFVPATLPAPVTMTEAAPHCQEITWRDSDRQPFNTVTITCGPNGVGEAVPFHWVGNASHVYSLLGIAVHASAAFPGIISVDGVNLPIWAPGEGPPDRIVWDYALDDGTLTFLGAAAANDPVGADIGINYQPQFPFSVTRSTGATPIVEHVEARPDVLSYQVAEEIATTLLAQAQAAPREAVITTDQDGFIPGQALTIDLPTTRSIAGMFLITSVGLNIIQDTAQGDRYWQYTLEAVESDLYHGSYLDGWREMAGVPGGGTTTIAGSAGPPGPAGPAGPAGPPGSVGGLPSLSPGHLFVGNASSVAADVPMSGDVTLAASGAATVAHVVNAATTATPSNVPNTIMARDASGNVVVGGIGTNFVVAPHIINTPAGDILIDQARDITLSPDRITWLNGQYVVLGPTVGPVLPVSQYKIDIGIPHQKFRAIYAAELFVESLVAQQTIATIGGRVLVAPTTMLTRDLAAASTQMYVKHNAFQLHVPGIETGSKLMMESAGKFELMDIVDATTPPAQADGSFMYTVRRNLDGTGANDWYAGDAILDTGKSTTTSGFIDLYSITGLLPGTGFGPAIVGNVRTTANPLDMAPRWAIGNLRNLYGYTTDTFGAAFGVPAGAWVKIDPTNGVRIGYADTAKIQLTAAGDAFFSGQIAAAAGSVGGWNILPSYLYAPITNTSLALNSAAPSIEIGNPRPLAYGSPNAGIWMGNDGGVYKFRACSAGGALGFFWDGTQAVFRGDGSGATNINGGNIQTDTITALQIAAGAIGASEIAARSITADRIVVGALTATEIAANTITGDRIAANTIGADRLSVNVLSAITANLGAVTAGSIASVSISGGSISGTNITGVSISGSSITAGSGNTITLDNSGLNIAEGNGGGSARINLGGKNMWGASGRIVFGCDVDGQFKISAGGEISTNSNLIVAGQAFIGSLATYSGGVRALYRHTVTDNAVCFWTGAAAAREAIAPWAGPADPAAVLAVPIVTYADGAGGRDVGIVVEALADVAPEAVTRDDDGAPDGVRTDVFAAYLLACLRALAARIAALEDGA